MNVAYLIIAHHQPTHLARLIENLDCKAATFFVHVDRKVSIAEFQAALADRDNVIFLEGSDRIKVRWGSFSVVRAALNLLEIARARGFEFSRFCLLSGSDFPIKANDELMRLFASTDEFMEVDMEIVPGGVMSYRLEFLDLCGTSVIDNFPIGLKKRFIELFNTENGLLRLRRRRFKKIRMYKGCAWWCLTRPCVDFVFEFLADNPDYLQFYRYSTIPDESFFHSIVKNSPFAPSIRYDLAQSLDPGPRGWVPCHYVDWRNGPGAPRTLDLSDMPAIENSNALFVRKIDEHKSAGLVQELENRRAFRID